MEKKALEIYSVPLNDIIQGLSLDINNTLSVEVVEDNLVVTTILPEQQEVATKVVSKKKNLSVGSKLFGKKKEQS